MGDVQLPSIFMHFHPLILKRTIDGYDGFLVAHELPGLGKSKGRRVSKKDSLLHASLRTAKKLLHIKRCGTACYMAPATCHVLEHVLGHVLGHVLFCFS